MKKLMTAVAIVCAAAMAQAASVVWNSGSTKLVDDKGATLTSLDSGSICLIVLTDNTGWSAGEWTAAKGTVTELATATIGTGKSAGKINGESYKFEYGTAAQKISDGDIIAAVFKDASGAYSQLLYYSDKSAITETLTVTGLADDENLWSKTFQFGQGSAAAGGIMAQSVPEPTSGLLLLLGIAGMALKRKRA